MAYLITLTIFLLLIISRQVILDKLSKTIVTMYLIWWGCWLVLSAFNFFNLFSVRTPTYLLLLLNISMFCVGFSLCGAFRNKNMISKRSINEKISRHSGFLKLLILVVVILLYYYLRYKNVVDSGSSLNIRMERFSVGNVFSSGPEIYLFNYFIESFIYATIVILAYMIIYGELINITFILLTLALFFYAGIGSSRAPIISILIAMTLIFYIRVIDSGKKIDINNLFKNGSTTKKIRFRNILFFVVVAIVISVYSAWATALRLGYTELNMDTIIIGWNVFLKQGLVYYTGPFRALDFGLEVYPKSVGYLFGRGTFAGIDEIINTAFRIVGIKYTSANGIIGGLLQNNQILIGDNIHFNFAYTSVMIHYFDFGLFGVIIFPFIYGIFVRKAVFLYEMEPTLPTLIIMVFLFITMINSVFSWGLQSPSSNIVLIGCYLWYKWNQKKNSQGIQNIE